MRRKNGLKGPLRALVATSAAVLGNPASALAASPRSGSLRRCRLENDADSDCSALVRR